MSAIDDIRAERQRQIKVEGYTAKHDDGHVTEALMEAAFAYEWHAMGTAVYNKNGIPQNWPWARHFWKPKDKRRDLIRAGALCLAEQDRCARDGMPRQALPDQTLARIVAELDAETQS